jgi:hypothetical protein
MTTTDRLSITYAPGDPCETWLAVPKCGLDNLKKDQSRD